MSLGGRCVELGEGDENFAFIDIWNRCGGFGEQHIVSIIVDLTLCCMQFKLYMFKSE